MIAATFSESSIIESFVSAGMIDVPTESCADIYTLTDSFRIDWSKVQGGKTWFMDFFLIL